MKVLYLVFKALLGGHVISASTVAREMSLHGVESIFAGGDGPMRKEIEKELPFFLVDIPVEHMGRPTYSTFSTFRASNEILNLIRKEKVDIVHAFDATTYMHAYVPCILENIPIVCTLCGGLDPYYNIPVTEFLMVFSKEQKNKMVKKYKWKESSVDIVRTRLDINSIFSEKFKLNCSDFEKYPLALGKPNIIMISRLDGAKKLAVRSILSAVEILDQKEISLNLVLIGGGSCFNEVESLAHELQKKLKFCEISLLGPVVNAFRYLQSAEIVLGVGRCLFEGMAYGKPSIVIGETGFAGIVRPETVDDIAYYNFSGRNQQNISSPLVLADALQGLLVNEGLRKEIGGFGRDYVLKEIDVKRGADRICRKYEAAIKSQKNVNNVRKWLSFFQCQGPVWRDNFSHSAKVAARNIFRINFK